MLPPLKTADTDKLAAVLKRAEQLAKQRDPEKDRAVLADMGADDPMEWSIEAVRALKAAKR